MSTENQTKAYSVIAVISLAITVLTGWMLRHWHQHEVAATAAMQMEFRTRGQAVIQPYQFPVVLSMDGRRLLTKEKTNTAFAFHVYQGGKSLANLNLENPQWEIGWNPSGTAVSFLSEVGNTPGVYAPYVWWIDQNHATVLNGPTMNRASYAFKWSPDGRYISYIAVSPEGNRLVILSVQENSSSAVMIVDDAYPDAGMAWSPNSEAVAYAQQNSDGFSLKKFVLRDTTTSDIAHLPQGKLKDLSWSPSTQTIATTFRSEDDHYFRLARLSPEGQMHVCPTEEGDVLFPAGVNTGDTLEFVVEKNSDQSIHISQGCGKSREMYHPQSGAGRLQNDGYSHTPVPFIESQTNGPAKLVLPSESASKEHTNTSITSPSTGKPLWLPGASHPVGAWLWEPDAGTPSARAIVMIHGGPRLHETNEWEPLREALSKHGYLVLAPNYGGSTGYGKQYEDVTDLDVQADDMVSAVRYLTDIRHIQPDHIAIFASSYGTRILLRALQNEPDLAPVIIFAPFLAAPADVEEPIPFQGRILAFHGRRDPISNSDFAFAALKHVFLQALSDHRLYWRLFDDEAHGSNRISSLQEEYGTITCVLDSSSCEQPF